MRPAGRGCLGLNWDTSGPRAKLFLIVKSHDLEPSDYANSIFDIISAIQMTG